MWKILILLNTYSLFWITDASCPNGWIRHANSCYHFSHDQEDWPDAVTMCHILGGKLVEIETADENIFLSTTATRFNSNYWIALSDVQEEGVWVWMENKTALSQTRFSYWSPGSPDNVGQNENCATLNGNQYHGLWNDWHCNDDSLSYICEKNDNDQAIDQGIVG